MVFRFIDCNKRAFKSGSSSNLTWFIIDRRGCRHQASAGWRSACLSMRHPYWTPPGCRRPRPDPAPRAAAGRRSWCCLNRGVTEPRPLALELSRTHLHSPSSTECSLSTRSCQPRLPWACPLAPACILCLPSWPRSSPTSAAQALELL